MSQRTPKSGGHSRSAAPLSPAQDSSPLNRNDNAKSLPQPQAVSADETDELALLRGLELGQLSPQQLLRLKRSPLMDPARFPQHELDQMRAELLLAENKPVVFEARRHYALNPQRLLRQLERALGTVRAGRVPRDLLHNFKRDGAVHRQLFEWAPLEAVRGVMGAVHFQIFERGAAAQAQRPMPRAPLSGGQVDLQNALIHSHWAPYAQCACAPLVYRLEVLLNAVLQRVLVHEASGRALFVLEWSEAPRFQYVVCLDVSAQPQPLQVKKGVRKTNTNNDDDMQVEEAATKPTRKKKKKSKEASALVELARTDLFDELAPVDQNEHSALRLLLRDGRPSYKFHAFVRCDDADQL